MRILLFSLVLVLSGCGDIDKGEPVKAWVQLDPYNPCRLMVSIEDSRNNKTISAIIEGCNKEK